MRKKKLGLRGYITTLGEDIPSLIPLSLAFLIFISSFFFAFFTTSRRYRDIMLSYQGFLLASSMKDDGYYICNTSSGTDEIREFSTVCAKARAFGLNFIAVVVDANEDFNLSNPKYKTCIIEGAHLINNLVCFSFYDKEAKDLAAGTSSYKVRCRYPAGKSFDKSAWCCSSVAGLCNPLKFRRENVAIEPESVAYFEYPVLVDMTFIRQSAGGSDKYLSMTPLVLTKKLVVYVWR